MPKYRLLTTDELKYFEKEFIDYLVINGIVADSWEKMKVDSLPDAQKIIELFSDVIFEKVLRKAKYLEQRMKNKLFCFYFGEKKAELMLVNFEGNVDVGSISFEDMMKELSNSSGMVKINYQTKTYTNTREKEIFDLIQTGCEITEGEIFEDLKSYYVKQSN